MPDRERKGVHAPVYDILPPTTGLIDYVVGLEKRVGPSRTDMVRWTIFIGRSNGSTFVRDKSNYIGRFFS